MSKLKDVTVEVKANVTVSEETANRCLRLLEMYMNDNNDKIIVAVSEGGKLRYHIEGNGKGVC